ncbi:MAG: hydantoinase B/oxoprolinase family protein [Chloroflexi bacterium]|nr:hydantoinase B/oxoprolinase family protein [Chloroflexota bacterium]
MPSVDPVTFQVIISSLSGIVREMQSSLFRTGYSTIIRESLDASCALLDRQGRLIGQYVNLTLHLGAHPACLKNLLSRYSYDEIEEGDCFIVNHPYYGGSPHSIDMGVITPVFHKGEVVAFCSGIAHKSDIGGLVPGSGSGQATEVFHEGILLPPVKYASRGRISKEIEALLEVNSRTPELVIGDIRGQMGTDRIGEGRVQKLFEKYGTETMFAAFDELFDRTEKRVRQEVASWPDGEAEVEGYLDNDGIVLDKPVRFHLKAVKKADSILFDFSGCDAQTRGPVNICPPLVHAAGYFALIALIDPNLPANHGLTRAMDTRFKEGTVVCPVVPAPVNCYAATHQLVKGMTTAAVIELAGQKPIAWGGGGGGVIIGWKSTKTGRHFVQYEMGTAGTGAMEGDDGGFGRGPRNSAGAVRSTAVEIVESEFPCRMLRWEIVRDSGGSGKWRGGPGTRREYLLMENGSFSCRGDKHVIPGIGIEGGLDGQVASITINPGTPQAVHLQARIGGYPLRPGDVLRMDAGGGGGVGDPKERDRQRVLWDLEDGYISTRAALEIYGLTAEELETVALPHV